MDRVDLVTYVIGVKNLPVAVADNLRGGSPGASGLSDMCGKMAL